MKRLIICAVLCFCMGQGCPAPTLDGSGNEPPPPQIGKVPAGIYSGERTYRFTGSFLGSSAPPTVTVETEIFTVSIDANGNPLDGDGFPLTKDAQYETAYGTGSRRETIKGVTKSGGYIQVDSFFETLIQLPSTAFVYSSGSGVVHYRLQPDGSLSHDMRVNLLSEPFSAGIAQTTWEYTGTLYRQ